MKNVCPALSCFLVLLSSSAFCIQPLSEEDMSSVNGQVSPLPAFLSDPADKVPENITTQSVAIPSLKPENGAPLANSGLVVPSETGSSLSSGQGVAKAFGVNLGSEGAISVNISAMGTEGSKIDAAVNDVAVNSFGAISGALGMTMNSMKIEGVSSDTSLLVEANEGGKITTTMDGRIDSLTIDQMGFGSNSLLQGYTMRNVEIRNFDASISIRQ